MRCIFSYSLVDNTGTEAIQFQRLVGSFGAATLLWVHAGQNWKHRHISLKCLVLPIVFTRYCMIFDEKKIVSWLFSIIRVNIFVYAFVYSLYVILNGGLYPNTAIDFIHTQPHTHTRYSYVLLRQIYVHIMLSTAR